MIVLPFLPLSLTKLYFEVSKTTLKSIQKFHQDRALKSFTTHRTEHPHIFTTILKNLNLKNSNSKDIQIMLENGDFFKQHMKNGK